MAALRLKEMATAEKKMTISQQTKLTRTFRFVCLFVCLFLQAALHKIATACGPEELQQRGACDLVQSRLLDVFLEYSSRPESYV